jgi:hypothetical protein
MRVRLETRHGGRIVSLKGGGGELTRSADAASLAGKRVPYKFGLLSLQLWQDSYWHNDLCHLDWPITGTTSATGRVEVKLKGQSVLWSGVNVTRTYRLTDDPWIDVDHNLDPGPTTQPYLCPSFWFSNSMDSRGTTFIPGPTGVLDLPRFPQDQSWCQQPTDGWIAWVGKGQGLAFTTEAPYLRHVRIGHLDFDRVEWIRRRVDTVEQGTVRLIPFKGLTRVDGVGEAGVLGATIHPGHIQVNLFAIHSGPVKITIWAVNPQGGTVVYGTATAQALAGQSITVNVPALVGVQWVWHGWLNGSVQIGTHPAAITSFRIPSAEGFQRDLRSLAPVAPSAMELPRADSAHRQPPRSFQFNAVPVPLPTQDLARPVNAHLRVLVLAPNEAIPVAQTLAQRFNFDLTLPYFPMTAAAPTGPNGIAGQRLFYELGDRYDTLYGDEIMAVWNAVLDPAKTYDVIMIVIGPTDPWSLLPQTLQANILSRVQAGTGLVMVYRNPPGGPNAETTTLLNLLPLTIGNTSDYRGPWHPLNDRTVRGLPWPLMAQPAYIFNYSVRTGAATLMQLEYGPPPSTLLPLLARTKYGMGTVLHLGWGQLVQLSRPIPPGGEGFENFRYDLDLLGRIIFDAANRPPVIAVQSVTLSSRGLFVEALVQLEQVSTITSKFDIDWQARDRFGALLGSGRRSFTTFPTGGTVSIKIPLGSWACDVVTTPSTGDSGWGAGAQALNVAFTVSPSLQAYDRSQSTQVTPTLAPGATHALVDLVDGRGRICARADVLPGASATLAFANVNTPSADIRVHALNSAGELLAQGFLQARITMRTGFDTWAAHFWNTSLSLPHRLQVRRLDANRSLGAPAYMFLGNATEELIAAADRISSPYVVQSSGWLWCNGGQTAGGNQGPISLVNTQQTITGQGFDRTLAASFADLNVLYYRAADDEPDPPATDVCFAPETLTWLRTWLASLYAHSDALLKAQWGAGATLAGATPVSYATAVAQFAATQTYAPWVDHRRFMMTLFSQAPSWARAALRQEDPFALVGTSGDNIGGMAEGRDWWVRGRALDMVGRYGTSTALMLAELGTLNIPWTGYDDPDPIIRFRIANSLGLGDPAFALFAESTLVNPDLSLAEVGRDLAAALLPMRRGLAKLFAQSAHAADGVFVLMSPDSSPVLAIHGYESLGSFSGGGAPAQTDLGIAARESIHILLNTMGIAWRALDPLDVESGALEREGARVLILPLCAALSDAACESIRRWVNEGGHVIADLLPATFNEHGRLRGTAINADGSVAGSTNPLDQVFGLTPGGKPPVAAAAVTLGGANLNFTCADTSLGVVNTAISGGSGPGGKPVWFSNNYGLGTGHYLACSFFGDFPWGDSAQSAQRRAMEEEFTSLLSGIGVTSHVQASSGSARASAFNFWVRKFGAAELIVLARNFVVIYHTVEPEADGRLRFNGAAHTYDLDEGTYLGFGNLLDLRIDRYTYRTFSRLPYRVLGVAVNTITAAALGQPISVALQIQTSGGAPGRHMVRIDVLDPNQDAMPYMSQEVSVSCGFATIVIPTAFNDPVGRWTIVATDLLTGLQGRAQVVFSGAAPVAYPDVSWVRGIDD